MIRDTERWCVRTSFQIGVGFASDAVCKRAAMMRVPQSKTSGFGPLLLFSKKQEAQQVSGSVTMWVEQASLD